MKTLALAVEPALLWLGVTLAAYGVALWLFRRARGFALLNPVLTSVLLISALLLGAGVAYADYFSGAQLLHFLLGPSTVALAVPLHAQAAHLKRLWLPIGAAIVTGLATATALALGLAALFGVSRGTLLSLAPKSVTTPIAIGIAETIGGVPALAVLGVIITGTVGAAAAGPLFERLGVRDPAVQGVALGVAAHGVGTAQAFQRGPECGAFAGLAMALAGLLTALVLPAILRLAGLP